MPLPAEPDSRPRRPRSRLERTTPSACPRPRRAVASGLLAVAACAALAACADARNGGPDPAGAPAPAAPAGVPTPLDAPASGAALFLEAEPAQGQVFLASAGSTGVSSASVQWAEGLGLLYAGGLLADPDTGEIRGNVETGETEETPEEAAGSVVALAGGELARVIVSPAGEEEQGIAASTGSPRAVAAAYVGGQSEPAWTADLGDMPTDDVVAQTAVLDGALYVNVSQQRLHRLDPATGAVLWSTQVPVGYGRLLADSEHLVVLSAVTRTGPMAGVDPATGKVLWSRESSALGPRTSVANGAVLSGGGLSSCVTGFDPATGRLFPGQDERFGCYPTPDIVGFGGGSQVIGRSGGIVVANNNNSGLTLGRGHDAATGKVVWELPVAIPTGSLIRSGRLYSALNDAVVQIDVMTGKEIATSDKLLPAEQCDGQIEGCNGRVVAVTGNTAVVDIRGRLLWVRLDSSAG